MKEIDIYNLCKEDAEALDTLLSACAEAAVKEAMRKSTVTERKSQDYRNNVSESLSPDGLEVLYKCYCKSRFSLKNDAHRRRVYDRLESELSRVFPTNKQECYNLLIPIMAYTLIVNNEYNAEAVRKRIRTAEKKHTRGNKGETYVWGRTDPFKISRSTKTQKSLEAEELINELLLTLVNTGSGDLHRNLSVQDSYLLLNGHELLMELCDCGNIALFLRDILLHCYQKSRPMDTLLRFYLANRLDNLLIKCRNFPSLICQSDEKQAWSNNLLTEYWIENEPDDRLPSLMFGDQKDETNTSSQEAESADNKPLGIEIPDDLHQMTFKDLYHKILCEFTISEKSLDELSEFYLDRDCLDEMSSLWLYTKEFVCAVIADINSCAQTTNRQPIDSLERLALHIMRNVQNYSGDSQDSENNDDV